MNITYEGRCHTCFMREEVCLCPVIPKITLQTHLTVVMHFREAYKTTNSGRIANLALPNSDIIIRGLPHDILKPENVLRPDYSPILLTLSDDSAVLSKEWLSSFTKPIQLVVPDGNWRQANKMAKRDPVLKTLPKVKLPVGSTKVRSRLRNEHNAEGMSTLEAIAIALGIIENSQVEAQLDQLYEIMVQRTLSTRPKTRAFLNGFSDKEVRYVEVN